MDFTNEEHEIILYYISNNAFSYAKHELDRISISNFHSLQILIKVGGPIEYFHLLKTTFTILKFGYILI